LQFEIRGSYLIPGRGFPFEVLDRKTKVKVGENASRPHIEWQLKLQRISGLTPAEQGVFAQCDIRDAAANCIFVLQQLKSLRDQQQDCQALDHYAGSVLDFFRNLVVPEEWNRDERIAMLARSPLLGQLRRAANRCGSTYVDLKALLDVLSGFWPGQGPSH